MTAGPPELREDRLLGGRVRLRQPVAGYRVALDPVLLAAAVPAAAGERALDLGCGSGAAGLCLLARVPDCRLEGLELQSPLAALAAENAELNGWSERFRVLEGDLLAPPSGLGRDFDHVLANPPYEAAGGGTAAREAVRAAAHKEGAARLADWIAFGLARLRRGGRLTLVQRAARLDEILAQLSAVAGAIAIFPLWPKAGRAAKRVLVQAVKGSRAPTRLLPGLLLHQQDGAYTAEAEAVLREGAALRLEVER